MTCPARRSPSAPRWVRGADHHLDEPDRRRVRLDQTRLASNTVLGAVSCPTDDVVRRRRRRQHDRDLDRTRPAVPARGRRGRSRGLAAGGLVRVDDAVRRRRVRRQDRHLGEPDRRRRRWTRRRSRTGHLRRRLSDDDVLRRRHRLRLEDHHHHEPLGGAATWSGPDGRLSRVGRELRVRRRCASPATTAATATRRPGGPVVEDADLRDQSPQRRRLCVGQLLRRDRRRGPGDHDHEPDGAWNRPDGRRRAQAARASRAPRRRCAWPSTTLATSSGRTIRPARGVDGHQHRQHARAEGHLVSRRSSCASPWARPGTCYRPRTRPAARRPGRASRRTPGLVLTVGLVCLGVAVRRRATRPVAYWSRRNPTAEPPGPAPGQQRGHHQGHRRRLVPVRRRSAPRWTPRATVHTTTDPTAVPGCGPTPSPRANFGAAMSCLSSSFCAGVDLGFHAFSSPQPARDANAWAVRGADIPGAQPDRHRLRVDDAVRRGRRGRLR